MLRLFINAIAASAGGGLTYVRNVLPQLAAREDVHTTALLNETLGNEIEELVRIRILLADCSANSAQRFWYEQRTLPSFIRRSGAHVLLSAGNFAVFRSPVPQILLSRNALYESPDFLRDLQNRGAYQLRLDTKIKRTLARWSVQAAECTVAPSAAFARDLERATGRRVISIHHGFDREAFFHDPSAFPPHIQTKLAETKGSLRLLFVSHYNYYRNFETLIRAAAMVKRKQHPRTVRLLLTCKLKSEDNPGDYRAETTAELVRHLGLTDEVVELGAVPYSLLHRLYQACDFYTTAAYAETFAHPLVEAMASGLPVIASDLPVHREVCGEAALYFPRFSPENLAETILRAAQSTKQTAAMRERGLLRSRDFSWDKHVTELLELATRLVNARSSVL
jgi:glycosyltransferase involved in cell wall biosynthesis